MKRTRPNVQAEHSLQVECLWHLKRYPVLALPTPNGIYFPCRTDDERRLRARIINRMKAEGMLIAGMSDMVLLWKGGSALIKTSGRPFARSSAITPRDHRAKTSSHSSGVPSNSGSTTPIAVRGRSWKISCSIGG